MLRVVIINQHSHDALGGSEIQCDLIARHLAERGHRVLYLAINGNKTAYDASYSVKPVARHPEAILNACKEYRPDVVYWRYNKHIFHPTMKKLHRLGIPVVFGVSSISDVTRFSYRPARGENKVLNSVTRIRRMMTSAWSHRGFKYVAGLTSLNSHYLNKVNVRKQMHLPNSMASDAVPFSWNTPFCVWVSNIKPSKNPEMFLELAKKLVDLQVDFLMVGKIQDSRYGYLNNEGLVPPNLRFLGPKTPEEVNGILRESLFLVHTCDPEGFGNNFIQAWLQGKPAVSLYFDPNGYLESEQIGFYSRNMQQFVSDVANLIERAELREQMGMKARAFAEARFDPATNIKKLEQFLEEVVNEKRANTCPSA